MRFPIPVSLLVLAVAAGACEIPPEEEAPGTTAGEAAPAGEAAVEEAAPARSLDPGADAVVRAMSDALRAAKTLSFRVESWTDEPLGDGRHVSLGAASSVLLRRPDRFRVERSGPKGRRTAWFDGTSFALCDPDRGLWARVPAPATVEGTLDMLEERFGVVFPLADLFVDDPHAAYTAYAEESAHLGVVPVGGRACHHLSFSADWIAWQIWVPTEGPPLPARVEIRYLDEPGTPRFAADLADWKIDPPAAEEEFRFAPPEGAAEIEILARGAEEGGGADAGEAGK
jgi:hypothetical protein